MQERRKPMLDLLAGIQIARKASEGQFAYDAHSRDGRPQKRRSFRHLLFFRRSRHEDRAQIPPRVARHSNPVSEPATEKGQWS
jgi:hypothetical protein